MILRQKNNDGTLLFASRYRYRPINDLSAVFLKLVNYSGQDRAKDLDIISLLHNFFYKCR